MNRFTIGVLLCIIAFLLLVSFQSVEFHLTNLTYVDDGFYYLGYARNIALGNGPTFDGLIETNGVQPIWALILVGVAALFPNPIDLMQAALVVSVGLAVISALAMADILRNFFAPPLWQVIWLIYLGMIASPQIILSGMETSANLAVFTLALAAVLRVRQPAFWPTIGAGVLVGLACLGRVDNVILAPTFALLLIWRNGILAAQPIDWKRAVRAVIWLALPVTAVFGAYLLFNLTTFHRPLPVSGMLKSIIQQKDVSDALGGRFSPGYLLLTTGDTLKNLAHIVGNYLKMPLIAFSSATLFAHIVLGLGLLIVGIRIILRRRSIQLPGLRAWGINQWVALLVIANVLFHSWMLFFQLGAKNASVLNWYFVPEYIFLTLGIGFSLRGAARWMNASPRFYQVVAGAVVVALMISAALFVRRFNHFEGLTPLLTHYRMTEWANANLPADATIGSYNAGVIGYFSEATVINLDGLMNNDEILAVAEGELTMSEYVDRHHIAWMMDYMPSDWRLDSTVNFQRNMPNNRLELVYSQPFDNYNFQPSVFYVFKVT